MTEIIKIITTGIIVLIASYLGTRMALNKMQWRIGWDKNREEMELKPIPKSPESVSFLPEATEEELREMEVEPRWRKFLRGFVKTKSND